MYSSIIQLVFLAADIFLYDVPLQMVSNPVSSSFCFLAADMYCCIIQIMIPCRCNVFLYYPACFPCK